MITVYHLERSRSDRVLWLLEELDIEYGIERFRRMPDQSAPPEMKMIHSYGRSPMVAVDNVVMIESGAIIEYLTERFGKGRLRPHRSSKNYPRYLQWLHFAEGTAMADAMVERVGAMVAKTADADPSPLLTRLRERNIATMTFLNDELEGSPYFAGTDFSSADIMMGFLLLMLSELQGDDFSQFPNLNAYVARLVERPGFIKAREIAAV